MALFLQETLRTLKMLRCSRFKKYFQALTEFWHKWSALQATSLVATVFGGRDSLGVAAATPHRLQNP